MPPCLPWGGFISQWVEGYKAPIDSVAPLPPGTRCSELAGGLKITCSLLHHVGFPTLLHTEEFSEGSSVLNYFSWVVCKKKVWFWGGKKPQHIFTVLRCQLAWLVSHLSHWDIWQELYFSTPNKAMSQQNKFKLTRLFCSMSNTPKTYKKTH